MKDIIIGFLLMYCSFSCTAFWLWFIDLEKTKQVTLKELIFKEE